MRERRFVPVGGTLTRMARYQRIWGVHACAITYGSGNMQDLWTRRRSREGSRAQQRDTPECRGPAANLLREEVKTAWRDRRSASGSSRMTTRSSSSSARKIGHRTACWRHGRRPGAAADREERVRRYSGRLSLDSRGHFEMRTHKRRHRHHRPRPPKAVRLKALRPRPPADVNIEIKLWDICND